MGKKATLILNISAALDDFAKCGEQIAGALLSFPKMKPYPMEHNAGPYYEAYYRECKAPGQQISDLWDDMNKAFDAVELNVGKLSTLLKSQKVNLFKRFSKGYKNATKFCEETKVLLGSMRQTAQEFEANLKDRDKAPEGLIAFFERQRF